MNKIKVIHFQRKPRPGFNFSIESIFNNLRHLLKDKVAFYVVESTTFNDGYLSKLKNIIEAACRQKKNTVAHITGEVHFLNLLMRKKSVLLTIHDCGYMKRKKGIAQKIVGWIYLRIPVKKAFFITTVSEATKKEIIDYTGCDQDKITVIPVNVNCIFRPFPKSFNKNCPVILQVGTGENKNVIRLIQAITNMPCKLVIIGELKPHLLEALKTNNIDYINKYNLSNDELFNEYINCDIVSFVSTFEGFGMPIVEANFVERTVITSNISSMPEIAGDAACFVDPYNVQSIREGMLKIIQDDAYRHILINNGKQNRKRFDKQLIADSYYRLYLQIYSNLHT